MESENEPREVKMTVKATERFHKVLNTLALKTGISRDELIEQAVRNTFNQDVRQIEAALFADNDDEGNNAPPTELSARLVGQLAG